MKSIFVLYRSYIATALATALIVLVLVAMIWVPNSADLFLGVFGFLVWLFFLESSAHANHVDRMKRRLSQFAPKSWHSWLSALKRIGHALDYSDLSMVMASLILLCVGLFNSFIAALQDLTAKGLLSYDPQMTGFVYLQIYAVGYISTPPLVLALVAYGFFRGIRDGQVSFAKLLVGIFLGFFTAAFFLSLVRGNFTGLENLAVAQANGSVEPSSSTNLMSTGLGILVMWLSFSALAWIFGLLGSLVKRFLVTEATARSGQPGASSGRLAPHT